MTIKQDEVKKDIENRVAGASAKQPEPRSSMEVVDVLVRARALIEKPENWSPNGWGHGDVRCAANAIETVAGGFYHMPAQTAVQAVCGGKYLGTFNDTHTHAEVLAAFDRAIEAERAKATDTPLTKD